MYFAAFSEQGETKKARNSLTWTLRKSKIVFAWMGGKDTKWFPIVYHFNIVRWYFARTFYHLIHREGEVINLCEDLKCSLYEFMRCQTRRNSRSPASEENLVCVFSSLDFVSQVELSTAHAHLWHLGYQSWRIQRQSRMTRRLETRLSLTRKM